MFNDEEMKKIEEMFDNGNPFEEQKVVVIIQKDVLEGWKRGILNSDNLIQESESVIGINTALRVYDETISIIECLEDIVNKKYELKED